jgi:hypothetical protein
VTCKIEVILVGIVTVDLNLQWGFSTLHTHSTTAKQQNKRPPPKTTKFNQKTIRKQ